MISHEQQKRYIEIITTKNTIGDIMYRKEEEEREKRWKKKNDLLI